MSSSSPRSGPPSIARDDRAWWRARARVAAGRTRRFNLRWAAGIGTSVLLALSWSLVGSADGAAEREARGRLAADTLRWGQRVREAEVAVARAESALVVSRRPPSTLTPAAPSSSPAIAPPPGRSVLAQLIETARRDQRTASALAVAEHPAVAAGPRMRALADTLRALEARQRRSATVDEARALVRTRLTILSIAETRDRELGSDATVDAPPQSSGATTGVPVQRTDTEATADTLALGAALEAARDSLMVARRAREASAATLAALPVETSSAVTGVARFTVVLALGALLLAGLLIRFLVAFREEQRRPTLADASEAERLTGLRVLAVVRDPPPEGPARFKPSGVDPFRMLYLNLTATGTRARTAVITGGEADIVAAVGARLAISAAADHRNTLIIDGDPAEIAVSRTFRERAEPGLRDVLARAFTWREVARPVGSSDGLPITLVPAGAEREDAVVGDAAEQVRAELTRLRTGYDLTLAVTAPAQVAQAQGLLDPSPVLVTAVVGSTPIDGLLEALTMLRTGEWRLQGLVLWSAPRPTLPSRAELAALLSVRKGRTPGGSFAAVQDIVGKKGNNNIT